MTQKNPPKSPFPSLAGSKSRRLYPPLLLAAIVNQAILLAPDHRSSAPSQGYPPVTYTQVLKYIQTPLQIHSLIQWRDRTGLGDNPAPDFLIKSSDT